MILRMFYVKFFQGGDEVSNPFVAGR